MRDGWWPAQKRSIPSLRVIGLAAKVRIHQIRALWMRSIPIRRLERYEDGINFGENFGIVALKNPSALGLIVRVENAQPLDLLVAAFFLGPHSVLIVCLLHLGVVQIVRVEDEGFAFGEEDAAKGWLRLAARVGIYHVDNM